jgi:hypothetical protein
LPNNPVWYGGSSIIIVTQMVLDPPGVRNCLKKGFILEFRPIRQVSQGQKSKNMEMTRTNMMLLFVGRKKKRLLHRRGASLNIRRWPDLPEELLHTARLVRVSLQTRSKQFFSSWPHRSRKAQLVPLHKLQS